MQFPNSATETKCPTEFLQPCESGTNFSNNPRCFQTNGETLATPSFPLPPYPTPCPFLNKKFVADTRYTCISI